MQNIIIEKNTNFIENEVDKNNYMKNILEKELNNMTGDKEVMFKNLLKEKKTLLDITNPSVITLTLFSVILLNILSISSIFILFDNKSLIISLSALSLLTSILYFSFSFSRKTYFGRFFSNIDIRLNKKEIFDKILNKLVVNKKILSSFKKVYGERELKKLMMDKDVITYQDIKEFIEKMEAEQKFLDKIKQRTEKEKKINEIVSSL